MAVATTELAAPIVGSTGSLHVDGNGDYVDMGNQDILKIFDRDFSISIWFKTSNATYMGLVGQGNPYFSAGSGSSHEGYDLRYWGATTKQLQLVLNGDPSGNLILGYTRPDDSGTSGVDESVLHDGLWHHVVVTIDNTASAADELIKLYLDGAEVASTANTQVGYLEGTHAFVGGKLSAQTSGYFNGYLDDLRVFHDVLTAADVAELGRTQEKLYETERRIEYTYDAFDRRIKKAIDEDADGNLAESADVVWQYVYDGFDIILAFDKDNNLKNRYLHGPAVDQILADEQVANLGSAGTVYWPLGDHQGSIRDVTDNNGSVVRHTVFDAFGVITSQTGTLVSFIYGFTGRERDDESIFDYHRARYYLTYLGVWSAPDPGGFAMGDENLYRYVGNSPTNFTDPSGLDGFNPFAPGLTPAGAEALRKMQGGPIDRALAEIWRGFKNGFRDAANVIVVAAGGGRRRAGGTRPGFVPGGGRRPPTANSPATPPSGTSPAPPRSTSPSPPGGSETPPPRPTTPPAQPAPTTPPPEAQTPRSAQPRGGAPEVPGGGGRRRGRPKEEPRSANDCPEPVVEKPTRATSPQWQKFKPFRGKTKTNGLGGKDRRYYEWDNTHGDIEVYDHKGKHMGTMDPQTGDMIKPPVPGYVIDL